LEKLNNIQVVKNISLIGISLCSYIQLELCAYKSATSSRSGLKIKEEKGKLQLKFLDGLRLSVL
jgi:hypothetical protein